MRIGITYDLKSELPPAPDLPDDFQEEFDSPITIEAIAAVLRGLGHDVDLLGDGKEMLARLLSDPPDLVFNFAEGQGIGRSREARVPAVLEMLDIPYTGSDPLTCAVTLDKDCAKRVARSAGVVCPRGVVLRPGDDAGEVIRTDPAFPGYPALLKPAWEGSSKGIRNKCLVESAEELLEVVESLRRDHRQPILVEEFIGGEEVTVGLVGNDVPQVIGVMRVIPRQNAERFVYSLEVKRDWEALVRYECPPRLPTAHIEAVRQASVQAFRVLGCRDVSRIDFRVRDGVPYFLEVNPLPGLNPETSDLVILARMSGWTYNQLIESILNATLERLAGTTAATMAR
jgi:D-alanine-D-alanine ligase